MDCKDMILSNDFADVILDFSLGAVDLPQEDPDDYCTISITDDKLIAYTRRIGTGQEMSLSVYAYRYMPTLYGLMQNEFDTLSLDATGVTQVQRPPLELTGKGVLIAFIDTGIDYTLPVFRDAAGNSRILAIWDQTVQTGTPPEGLLYGSEYTREDLQQALASQDPYSIVPSRDENGHGTAIASVAAGSRISEREEFLGVAPDADILVVKLKECKPYLREYYMISSEAPAYAENDIMLALKYVQSYLVPFQRPVVVCLGLGTNWGDHTGSAPLGRYLNETAIRRNMGIVVCGGNEGNTRHHFKGRLEVGSPSPENYQDVEIRVGEGENGFFMELWGSVPDTLDIDITSPGGESVQGTVLGLGQSVTYRFIYERTRVSVFNILVEAAAGEQLIILRFMQPTAGVWRIRVSARETVQNGNFNVWLPITQFLTAETYFLEASPDTTLTEPSLASNVITVSTYDAVNNSFYPASGRGYARDNRIKPELAAPGVDIPTINGRRTGSSMAAAITAGTVAQFMEWAVTRQNRPFVTSLEIRNYLIRGAQRTPSVSYPDQEWGYGRLNIAETFDALAGV
ncbi:MAG: peptidase [Lachnospiraceae bacterium]|nr:peptidase [Lachnospiraceae bacterium]